MSERSACAAAEMGDVLFRQFEEILIFKGAVEGQSLRIGVC